MTCHDKFTKCRKIDKQQSVNQTKKIDDTDNNTQHVVYCRNVRVLGNKKLFYTQHIMLMVTLDVTCFV